MDNVNFESVLKSYIEKDEGVNYDIQKKPVTDEVVIANDLNRFKFLSLTKQEDLKSVYLKSLEYCVLVSIPSAYLQGMHEIASVFVFYYFSRSFDTYSQRVKDSDNIADVEVNFMKFVDSNEGFKQWMAEIKDDFERLRVVLINLFERKYEPLVKDELKLYNEYAQVFRTMMQEKGILIGEAEVHQYMESILTFGFRNVSTIEDAYELYKIVLSCPPSSPFLILMHYYDYISERKPIPHISSDTYNSVIALQRKFTDTLEDSKKNKRSFFSKYAVFLGGAVGIFAAVVAYKISKRFEE